jgi:glycine C-acetyltransferase
MTVQFTVDGVPEYALLSSMRVFRVPTGSDLLARTEDFFAWEDVRRGSGTWPFSRSTEVGPAAACAVRDDRGQLCEGVNFASQDYLSLASHPAVEEAARRAIGELGVHSAGSP